MQGNWLFNVQNEDDDILDAEPRVGVLIGTRGKESTSTTFPKFQSS